MDAHPLPDSSFTAMTTAPNSASAEGALPTRAVHFYATMRLRVVIPDAISDAEAIAKAESCTDLNYALRNGEYADEISGYLVDELDLSGDIVSEAFYDRDGNLVPPGLDPVALLPALTGVVSKLATGELAFTEARGAARAALGGVELPISRPAGVEEQVVAVVSASHMTEHDSFLLGGFATVGNSTAVVSTGFGSMVSLCQWLSGEELAAETAAFAEEGFSDAFIALWSGFRTKGYHWLNLDRDGASLEGFATHSW